VDIYSLRTVDANNDDVNSNPVLAGPLIVRWVYASVAFRTPLNNLHYSSHLLHSIPLGPNQASLCISERELLYTKVGQSQQREIQVAVPNNSSEGQVLNSRMIWKASSCVTGDPFGDMRLSATLPVDRNRIVLGYGAFIR
jgi:hypothetical protein